MLHRKLKAKDGQAEAFTKILLETSAIVSSMKGCRFYIVSRDQTDRNAIWVTELWNSKQEHDQSLQDGRVKSLISRGIPLLDGPPQGGQELEVLGGMEHLPK